MSATLMKEDCKARQSVAEDLSLANLKARAAVMEKLDTHTKKRWIAVMTIPVKAGNKAEYVGAHCKYHL